MAANSFGNIFRITTWGESHGAAVGVVIDGCPAGLPLDETMLNRELARRAPGSSPFVSPRQESDLAEIQSGVFQGHSTGAPISIRILNSDADSAKYEPIARHLRPGHANYTYLEKYGIFDYRGGGRASARETAARVAAGAVAGQLLAREGIQGAAWLSGVGPEPGSRVPADLAAAHAETSPIFAPSAAAEAAMIRLLAEALEQGDSLGGTVDFQAAGLPPGLGDPVYNKLEALLAYAMLGLPASKAFEIGGGVGAAACSGSLFNDPFEFRNGRISPCGQNNAGGVLGGISSGQPVYGRVTFKPTPSIRKSQPSLDLDGNPIDFVLPKGSRHDPCVAVRAVPVVLAMLRLVLADALLLNRCARV